MAELTPGQAALAEIVARLEAERYGPPVREFGAVDGPQRQGMLQRLLEEQEQIDKVIWLERREDAAQKEYDRRVARKRAAREASA